MQALLFARGILWEDCECVAIATISKSDHQLGIAHEPACLCDIKWVDFAHGRLLHSSVDSRNTVLLERPSPSPALNSKRVLGVSSVMYITVRWERQYHAYVLGR